MITEFIVGQKYTNDQIGISLNVENLGGIRPAIDSKKRLRHIAIMTNLSNNTAIHSENPYQDRIEADILTFTGQGKKGNQLLSGRNKRITEQFETPIPLYCFENTGRQTYTFHGLLELLRHYQEPQIDSNKDIRNVLVFEFRIHHEVKIIPIEMASTITESILIDKDKAHDKDGHNVDDKEVIFHKSDTPEILVSATEDIRSRLLTINPYRFEYLIKELAEKTGFCNVSVTPPSQDGGIDINAYTGNNNIFFAGTHVQFQAKRWRHSVGSVDINNFRGAISASAKGVFVTTSHFTKAATQEAKTPSKPSIALIDGHTLSKLITDNKVDISNFEET